MQNKSLLVLLIAILLALALCAKSSANSKSFYFGGGFDFPIYPTSFSNTYDNGYHLIGRYGFQRTPQLEFLIGFHYMVYPYKDSKNDSYGYHFGDLNFALVGFDIKLKFTKDEKLIKGSFLLGGGFAIKQRTNTIYTTENGQEIEIEYDPETKGYINLGFVFEYSIFFADIRGTMIIKGLESSISEDAFYGKNYFIMIPVTFGVKF